MEDKRSRCKVCQHKRVAQINQKIRNGDSINSLSKLYGISRKVLSRHRDECMADILAQEGETKEALMGGDSLIKGVRDQISLVHKLVQACDEYLTDPDDPEKYFLGPRGEEIDVVYQATNERTGRLEQNRLKATLQELMQSVESRKYVIRGITNKQSDPRDLLLKAIGKMETMVKMINESTQRWIEWEYKKAAMEKLAAQGGEVSIENEVKTITERVTIALKNSNSEELCKEAGLPDLL